MKLEQGRISGGVWEALATAEDSPIVVALHGGRGIDGVSVTPVPGPSGRFAVRVPIPAWALNEGVQTIVVQSGGETVATFTLVAGEPLEQDMKAELSLLRAELDLLKRAFQQHVRET